jgi:hypothetical protein
MRRRDEIRAAKHASMRWSLDSAPNSELQIAVPACATRCRLMPRTAVPCVAELDGLIDSADPEAGFAAIDALVDTLRSLRDAVPLP